MITVRKASVLDAYDLVTISTSMFAETDYAKEYGAAFDPEHNLVIWTQGITESGSLDEKGRQTWVAVKKGKVIGALSAIAYPLYHSSDLMVAHDVFFGVPGANARAAAQLMESFEKWCKASSRSVMMQMFLREKTLAIDPNVYSRMLRKHGFSNQSTGQSYERFIP